MEHILLIREWTSVPYTGIELIEQWQSPDNHDVYRDVTYKEVKRNHREKRVNGVKVYCQANLGDPVEERKMYAFRVSLPSGSDIHWNNLDEAKDDIARLEKISKSYQAMTERLGDPAHFAQFASYIADILGAEFAMYRNDFVQSVTTFGLRQLEKKVLGIE